MKQNSNALELLNNVAYQLFNVDFVLNDNVLNICEINVKIWSNQSFFSRFLIDRVFEHFS